MTGDLGVEFAIRRFIMGKASVGILVRLLNRLAQTASEHFVDNETIHMGESPSLRSGSGKALGQITRELPRSNPSSSFVIIAREFRQIVTGCVEPSSKTLLMRKRCPSGDKSYQACEGLEVVLLSPQPMQRADLYSRHGSRGSGGRSPFPVS